MKQNTRHLYVHVPFCHRICPYCSFYKHLPGGIDHGRFVQALISEAKRAVDEDGLVPETIYFGGGTPTAFSPAHWETLLNGFSTVLDLRQVTEWTVEANPMTMGAKKNRLLRQGGVTRISLGVQAWEPEVLKVLGRDHSPEEAEETFHELRAEGFPHVNLDLMFSVPSQNEALWRASLEKSIAFSPDHISAYNLTYEEDTEFLAQFKAGKFSQSEDENAGQFYLADELLEAAGFEHYEISNYAKSGHHSRHNQAYWFGADYVGLGPGAVSTVRGIRRNNIRDTALYMALVEAGGDPATEKEILTHEAMRMERVALELRTQRGLATRWLCDTGDWQKKLAALEDEGFLLVPESGTDYVRLSKHGLAVADAIAEYLLP